MKINKNDLMSDELWRYTMVDGQKRYVQAKKRMLDINTDSKVGQVEYNGNANIGMDYISPASNEELTAPKELPWNGMNVTKSNAYNNYKAKPPTNKGGGYVAPIPEDYSKMISYQPWQSYAPSQSKEVENKDGPSGFKNFVWWVLNAATELPAMLWKWIATWVWAIAKLNPYADDAAIDKTVKNYKDYVDKDRSNYFWEDQNSKWFTAWAVTANVVPILAWWAAYLWKQGLKQWLNTTSAFNNIWKNAWKGTVNINMTPTYKWPDPSLSTAKADAAKFQWYTNEYNKLLNIRNQRNLTEAEADDFNKLESLIRKK